MHNAVNSTAQTTSKTGLVTRVAARHKVVYTLLILCLWQKLRFLFHRNRVCRHDSIM